MEFLRKLIFNRLFFISISLMFQVVILISVIIKFNDYFAYFYALSIIISIIVVLAILNSKSNPAYKIAWIIPILLFPIFGGLFYLFLGRHHLSKRLKRKMKYINQKINDVLALQPCIINQIEKENITAANQSRYIQNYSFCPVYCNTFSEFLPSGEYKFKKLLEELNTAKHYIFLEYYIIEEGLMWNTILYILIEKARAGVDVRIIYDDVGCLLKLPYGYPTKLASYGIKCKVFNPIIPLLSIKYNNRDHRKIAIIDGMTGFTGGINLADEYINEYEKLGHWKDTAIMLKGEAVWSLTVIFLSMWDYLSDIDEDFKTFRNFVSYESTKAKGYIQPFADSPIDDEAVGETIYLNIINKAKRYLYITTPYLIIDNEMVTALSTSAKCGIDVRIITPYLADKWFVHEVTRSYYKTLIESGVKIYEYTPGFIHSKTFLADDAYGVIGTINMDYRSLYLHFECGVWFYNTDCIEDLKKDFLETLEKSKQIHLRDYDNVKWYKTLVGSVLRIFAPLM